MSTTEENKAVRDFGIGSKTSINKPTPITAQEFTQKWLRDQRTTIIRDNHTLRAGYPACIEVHGPRGWYVLMLPNNGWEFASTDDRDMVFRWLTGAWEIPMEKSA